MEKIYKPQKFNASEKVNLKEVFASLAHFSQENHNLGSVGEEQPNDLVFEKLKVDELERHRLITDCSIDLLNPLEDEDVPKESDDAKHLDTVRVRETYKASLKEIYIRHPYHKDNYENETPNPLHQSDLEPGGNLAVLFRIYHPFRFCYSTTGSKKTKPNSYTNLKFSHEIIALGSNTLAEFRDVIRCSSDLGLCVEVNDGDAADTGGDDPKQLYPSGFFFIDDTFYNDLRSADSIDYSEVIRRWGQERDITPLHVSCMTMTQIKELTPRFGYPYVYVHQGNCEHVFVFSDTWVLSGSDNLNSKAYPMCTGIHQSYSKLCHVCGTASAKWICLDSDRLPQDRMLFCNMCFRSYNYNDGERVGNFKAYPFFNTSSIV